jgi:hypothetical protein
MFNMMLRLLALLFLFLLSAVVAAADYKIPTKLPKTECLASDEDLTSFHCLPTEPLRIACIDTNAECPKWAQGGECPKNPQFMLIECRKSCQSCIALHHGDKLQIAPHDDNRPQVLQKLVETQEYQHKQAEKKVELLKTCLNKDELCTHWSLIGECESNPTFMQRECAPACRVCDKL